MTVEGAKSGIAKIGKVIGYAAFGYIVLFGIYSFFYFSTSKSRLMEYGLSEATAKLLAIGIMLIAIAIPIMAALRIIAMRGRPYDYAAVMVLPLISWGISQLPARFSATTGEALEYCVTRPGGEEYCSDHEGFDPATGLPLVAITRNSAEEQYRRERGMYPNLIETQFENIEFFDTLSNRPKVWVYLTGDGCFEAYDNKGSHPREGVALIPVSREHIVDMRECLANREKALKQQRVAEEAASHQREKDRKAAEALENKLAYQSQYTRRTTSSADNAIAIVNGKRTDSVVARAISNQVAGNSSTSFLQDASISDGVFDRLYNGDVSEFEKLDISQIADVTILGKFSITFTDNSSLRNGRNADATLVVRSIESSTGSVIRESFSSSTAVGYSDAEARQKAIEELVEELAAQLK